MTIRDLIKKRKFQVAFEAITIEGGLLSPEWLNKISKLQADLQSETDYKIPKGLTLRDEIGRYWRIAEAFWNEYQLKLQNIDENFKISENFITSFLKECLGFDDLQIVEKINHENHIYPISHLAGDGLVPIVFSSPKVGLDELSSHFGEDQKKRTAFNLLQGYLNASDQVLWGVVCDGNTIRIARDNASLTKPAWIQADLKRIFEEGLFADFAAFWLLFHRTRFGKTGSEPNECTLEQWRKSGLEEGTRARDLLRTGVKEALEILGQGFISHSENTLLREKLQAGALSIHDYFQELLRLIYRLIFLITIEERGLLHPTETTEAIKSLYLEGYSLRRIRDRSVKRHTYDRFSDLWESLKIVFRGFLKGEQRLGIPALGGLFGEDQTPTLMSLKIENRYLLQVVLKLCWLKEESGVSRVNWRDMGPEELGSVYEGLLELIPLLSDQGRKFCFASGDEEKGNARKLTGSYYTPDSLVQSLLDTALEPVIQETITSNPAKPLEALLELSILDPACGSGHFILGAARRLAGHIARLSVVGSPTTQDYRNALRLVISKCIYGVDKNPMALELARTALWLEAMTPDSPLSFVDHHLICGDSLLGLIDLSILNKEIPKEAYKTLSGDDKTVVRDLAKENRDTIHSRERARAPEGQGVFDSFGSTVLDRFSEVERMPDDTLEATEEKRLAFREVQSIAWNSDQNPIGLAADLFITAFLAKKTSATASLVPTTLDLFNALNQAPISNQMKSFVRETAKSNRVLHWKLKFSQVFAKGGFDVVIGNPPWERIKIQEQEFFASRSPEIASARNKAERQLLIDAIKKAIVGSPERKLYEEFERAKHDAEAISMFAHNEARFPLTGTGDVNTYALFAETALNLISKKGRVGIIVPSGISFDDSTSTFFSYISDGRLVRLIDFENREQLFPVHRSQKFSLLTLGQAKEAVFSFFLTNTQQTKDKRSQFKLSAADISKLNPNTKTCAIFRSEMDAELIKKVYDRVPVLWDETREDGNPWGLKFATMFHMSNDSHLFRTSEKKNELEDPVVLYEAKMIGFYDHRAGSYDTRGLERGSRVLPEITLEQYSDNEFEVTPYYWVERSEVENRIPEFWKSSWQIAWCNVTSSTNERTLKIGPLPRVGCGNSATLLYSRLENRLVIALLATLSSIPSDYISRNKIGGLNFNQFFMKQLPIFLPSQFVTSIVNSICNRVVKLVYTSHSMSGLAKDLGYLGQPFRYNLSERNVLKAEIDAIIASMYGFSREELRYILDPIEIMGPDYPSETFRGLKKNEINQYGEYLTQRLCLEAWDRLEKSGELPKPVEPVI